MNPLNRRMFRDPRAARRATGILASSAPLMTAAQKAMAQGRPMRAQTGAAVNTRRRTVLEDLAALPSDIASVMPNMPPFRPPQVTPQGVVAGSLADRAIKGVGSIRVGNVNPENIFTDGSPADILTALRYGVANLPQVQGADPSEYGTSRQGLGRLKDFFGFEGLLRQDRQPSIYQKAAQEDAIADMVATEDAVRQAEGFYDVQKPAAATPPPVPEGGGEAAAKEAPPAVSDGSNVDPGLRDGVNEDLTPPEQKPTVNKTAAAVMPSTIRPDAPVVPKEASSNEASLTPVKPDSVERGGGTVDPATKEAKKLTPEDLLGADGSLLKGETDAEKAAVADEAAGIKGTLKERVLQRMELQRELLGDDVDIRNDANYAAMMFGLALASGDSGDFKTDLANAGKSLLKMKGQVSAEQRAQTSKLASDAMNAVLASDEAEAQRQATRDNLVTQLSSDEKLAIMRDGTQRDIALAGINAEDRRLATRIESAEWLAQYNATNEFKLAAARMDHDSRLAAITAKNAFDRAVLSADTQKDIAKFTQESMNNRLDTQIEAEIAKLGEDSAEVKRLKFLQANPAVQDMLIDIAKKSKGNTNVFSEELALKLAGNQSLMMFPGGAEALFSTMQSLAKGDTTAPAGPGVLPEYEISALPDASKALVEGKKDGDVIATTAGNYVIQGGRLVPQVN